ncbi:MAG: peptidase M48 [Candidatus Cloacimonas sp. 4484_140]|nr:MAG: peptidase M48 [Candidatus Cloacimonas sp. 4484_140]
MKRLLFLLITFVLIVGCSTVPITGRKTLNLIPESQMNSMSFTQYDEFLKTNKLSNNRTQINIVKRVGHRIQKAVEQYFADNGMSNKLSGYEWEFNLLESNEVNAWCMPGGKVVVYTGILPVTKDETGLAVVMGHEIAHAIAGHGSERMSQGMLAQLGGMALETALEEKPDKTKQVWMTVFGVGTQFGVMLPFSRMHESEADHLGLIFMAMAGYDPAKAVEFWERMSAMKGGQAPPEFMSTHPADATRISNLKKLLPEALNYYKKPAGSNIKRKKINSG